MFCVVRGNWNKEISSPQHLSLCVTWSYFFLSIFPQKYWRFSPSILEVSPASYRSAGEKVQVWSVRAQTCRTSAGELLPDNWSFTLEYQHSLHSSTPNLAPLWNNEVMNYQLRHWPGSSDHTREECLSRNIENKSWKLVFSVGST